MDAFVTGAKPKKPTSKNAADVKRERLQPWVEKYRPKTVDEVAFQDEVVAVLKKCISGSDLPNLIFYGPPGTGKTSAILAAAREIFGTEGYRGRVLEMNASDERGIQVVRDKIKGFARLAVGNTRPDGKPCPALKLIILDEADSMTAPAQAALRRTIEKESKTTRFCLVCNYVSRIIDPLTSRCAKFRFKPLTKAIQIERLNYIGEQEGVHIDAAALGTLVDCCQGDLRKAITYLQSASRFHAADNDQSIKTAEILELIGVVPDDWLTKLIAACSSGKYETVDAVVQAIGREGFSANQLMTQLFDIVVKDERLEQMHKARICDRLGLCESRLMDGANEYLQLMDLAQVMMLQYKMVA